MTADPARPDHAPDDAPAASSRAGRVARRVGYVVVGLVGLVALAVVGVLVYLQTAAGQEFARGLVVGQIANVFADDAEVSADAVGGSFLSDARLTGLEVRRDGEVVVAVDTVLIDYNLTTLLQQTFSASELYVGRPRVTVRQRADSTFNVAGLLKPADPDKPQGAFTVRIDRAVVADGLAEVHWYRPEGEDSVHTVRDLGLVLADLRVEGDSLSGDIEALEAVAVAPFDRAEARLAASGAFSKTFLDLRALSVTSRNGTDLDGQARLVFTGDGSLPVFDADLTTAPLALEDARAFAGVPLYGDPRIRLRADSDGEVLTASLNGALGEAAFALDGEFSRDPDGPVRYRAEGTLRRFNPAEVTGNEALGAEVTGELRLNLQGSSLETLSGPFRVALQESRVGERTIDRLLVDGSFAAGRVTFDVDGAIPGASLRAEGLARPFDDVPTFQVAGTAQDVDLGVLLPGSGRTDAFAGEFALVGRGATAETFSGTVALDLTRAEIGLPAGRLRLTSTQVDADIDGGVIDFDADATLAGDDGRVAAVGTLRLGEPLRYEVTDGEAYGLNLAALTFNPSQESDVTGTFTLSGAGVDPTAAEIDLTASLGRSRYGTFDLDAAELAVELRAGVAAIDADLDFGPGGRLTAVGTARPFAQPLAYDLEGTMRNLDLGTVLDDPTRSSDLTGAYAVDGAGVDPATLALTASVQITAPSSFGDRLIDAADLVVGLDAGFLTVEGTATTPEGSFDVALSGRPFGEGGPSFAFERACFSDLDASDFAPTAPRTDLNGCFAGQVAGFADLPTANASGTVTLRPSRIGDAEVEDGRLTFRLNDGALAGSLALTLASPYADEGTVEGGEIDAAFRARPFDDVISYAVEGTTTGADLGLLLDLPPDQPLRLTSAFDVSGRGTDPETLTLDGALRAGPSALGPVALDTLATGFSMAAGVLRVDTLRAESDLLNVRGGGSLALFNESAPSDFRVEGAIESLAPLAARSERVLGLESGTFVLNATAEPGRPIRVLGTAEARQLVVDDYAVTGLDATIDGAWDRAAADSLGLGALSGEVRTSFAVLSAPTFRVEGGTATVSAVDGDLVVDGAVTVDERRDLAVNARVDLETNGITLERGQFRLDDTTWQLLQPAEIAVELPVVDVRGLILAADQGGQQIAADGQIDLEGEQNLIVTVENVAIGGLTDLVNLDALGGDLSATLVLSGPAEAPLIDGTVSLVDLTSRGRTVGALEATIDYADDRLGLDAALTHVDGERLTVRGTVPLQFSLTDGAAPIDKSAARVDLRAQADAFPIAWARPFLDERAYTALGGTLRLDLTVSGTQASPQLDGVATLSDGRLGVVATGRVYEPVEADVTFQNDRIVLDDVRILAEGGRTALDVTGAIRLRELSVGELDLTIVPREFVAMDTRTFQELVLDRGTQPLQLTGTLDRPVLRGSVVLSSGDIYLTDELVPPDLDAVTLTDAQIREVEARFGRVITARDTAVSQFVDALDYDLTVEIERDVWLRSEAGLPFDVEFSGDVTARKTPFAEGSRLFGRIDLVRGSVETLNRQFEIDEGRIQFNGDPLAADIDLSADLEVRLPGTLAGQSSATITLSVTGDFNRDLAVRFSSNPSMEPADIVSLIATGRLADELVSAGAAGGLAFGYGLGRASGLIEGIASEGLGLSMAQIDYEGGDLVVKFGDYFTNRLFWTAGFIVPLGGDSQQGQQGPPVLFALDYELRQWLSAQTEYSGQRGIGGGLSVERAW